MTELNEKRLQSFGRIKSKKLSPNQERLFAEFLPKVSVQSFSEIPEHKYLVVEIGFGCAEHLIHQAKSNPDNLYIGCEPFINGSVKALAQIEQQDISNIRIYNGDARDLLGSFPEESIDKIYILQPDPWPKKRHYKRRLINDDFLNFIAKKIKKSAIIRISTDDYDYAKWIVRHFLNNPRFIWAACCKHDWQNQPNDHIETKYQKKALKAGRKAIFMHFIREEK